MTKRSHEADIAQEPAAMEQVRELLFGAQLKDMDTRFQRQEDRFLREITDVRESLKTRLDSLENFMKSETSSLLHRLKEEQTERENALKDEQRERAKALTGAAQEMAALSESLERKIAKVSGTLDATERELRSLLLTQTNTLSATIDEKYEDALNVLAQTAAQIRDDMVYRSALSGMFTQVALKLSGQWTSEFGQMASGGEASTHGQSKNVKAAASDES